MATFLNILLADDDPDDRFFFSKALQSLTITTHLTTVEDGEKLLTYLSKEKLPDVLFLDLNMPRFNGLECLIKIKSTEKLKTLPVIIYSTSLSQKGANELYDIGAHYYMQKSYFDELTLQLNTVLTLLKATVFTQPERDQFILHLQSV